MARPSVVFVGASAFDAIGVVRRYPSADERVEALDLVYAGGGPAATAAVAAHRQGVPVVLVAPIATDLIGTLIVEDLQLHGIETDRLQVTAGRRSQGTVVVCSIEGSSRSITSQALAPFALSTENAELVRSAEWVHVDHLGWPAVEAALAGLPLSARPRISVDAGHSVVGDASGCDVSRVDLYVPPLERLRGDDAVSSDSQLLRACPARSVVATRGADGAIGRDDEGRLLSVPGIRVDDFGSTLGAGDVFHGALVARMAEGDALGDALPYANAVAALSCRGVDGRSRIPTRTETLEFLAGRTHS